MVQQPEGNIQQRYEPKQLCQLSADPEPPTDEREPEEQSPEREGLAPESGLPAHQPVASPILGGVYLTNNVNATVGQVAKTYSCEETCVSIYNGAYIKH